MTLSLADRPSRTAGPDADGCQPLHHDPGRSPDTAPRAAVGRPAPRTHWFIEGMP